MTYSTEFIKVLVVEDNEGDFIIIEELLAEEIKQPEIVRCESLSQTIKILQEHKDFDVVILDLSLPDASGESLVAKVLEFARQIPVIVLTGYIDKNFGIATLTWGVSDYMLKDDLQSLQLYKSISYGMERKKISNELAQSEYKYRSLFRLSPIPMWVYNVETLKFLDVNEAASRHYDYSREEFLTMTIRDIHVVTDIPVLESAIEISEVNGPQYFKGISSYKKKNSDVIQVEIESNIIDFNGIKAKLVLANDITERWKAEESIRFQAHLLNTVEQAVIATDLEGIVTYWNQFAEKLYGWLAEEAVGCNIIELTTPKISPNQTDIIKKLKFGESWSCESIVRNKNGTNFPAYISSSPVNDGKGTLIGFVEVSIDITKRKYAEEALQTAAKRERAMIENALDVICTIDAEGQFASVSPASSKVWGYQPEELVGRRYIELVAPEDIAKTNETALEIMSGVEARDFENRCLHKNGSIVDIRWTAFWSETDSLIFCVAHDVTLTKELERQLRQAQKLESVGMLAGGIAHDFNNMLTAINGYSDLTLKRMAQDDPLRRNLEEIKKAGLRSADLTHQLLAFSRQQVLQPLVVDLNEMIAETIIMLQRLIGEDIELTAKLNSKVGRVKVDPGQFSQIIMNLAVNARDAMPQGGKLTIELTNVFLDPGYTTQNIGVLPGAYVVLAVSDTGTGMSDETKRHIFEPFFTTKEVGQGTGLGLATVYGIVNQSGGNIKVYSEPGVGTTFKIYLPLVIAEVDQIDLKEASTEMPMGTETILLVEDEEIVRNLSKTILETCGYTVIEARNGLEAMEIFDNRDHEFDLLMTDVVMPQMGGRELADKLTEKMPNLQILFTSGYTDDAVVRHGVIEANTNFIQKPFSPEALVSKIGEILANTRRAK